MINILIALLPLPFLTFPINNHWALTALICNGFLQGMLLKQSNLLAEYLKEKEKNQE